MSWYLLVNYAHSWLDDIWQYLDLRTNADDNRERLRRKNAEIGRRLLLQRMWNARRSTMRQRESSGAMRWRRAPGAAAHKVESFTRKRKQVVNKHKKQVQRSIRCRSNITL